MKKFKMMFDKDKEIQWLNEMCRKGWALKRFKYGLYTFEPCSPGEYVFETDLNDRMFSLSQEYRNILEDMDIEFLCCSGFWFLVRRRADKGPLELYTDYESKIAQYTRIRNMFKRTALLELIVMYMELFVYMEVRRPFFLVISVLLFLMFLVLFRAALTMDERMQVMKAKAGNEDVDLRLKERTERARKVLMVGIMISCLGLLDIFPETVSCFLMGAGFGIELVALIVFLWRRKRQGAME